MSATSISQSAVATDRPTRRQWWSLLVLGLGLAIVIIDGTIVNVAIPSIRKDLGASLKDVEWVSSIYSLIYAALIVTFGRIGDQIGRRALFVAGVGVFILGSVLAGAAGSIGALIAARALQGLGAAMTSPSTLSIISATFTGRFRGVAFGVWGAVAGAAAALGPLLGGFLTTNASWRWAFYINVPIGLAAILGAIFVVQESVERKGRLKFDVPGIILVGLGIGGIVFGLIEGQTYGWWAPKQPFTLGSFTWPFSGISITPVSFLVGILALTGFVLWELRLSRRGGDPVFDFTLLRFRGFRFGLITVAIVALGEFGVIFVLSLFLQGALGYTAFQTGLTFLPFAILTLFVAPVAGLLSARFGPKWVVTSGMLIEALSIFLLSQSLSLDLNQGTVIAILLLYGLGVGLAIAQLTNVVLSEVPRDRLGSGSGANNTIRQVGAAMGIAIIGAILATTLASSVRTGLDSVQGLPPVAKAAIVQGLEKGGGGEGGIDLSGAPTGAVSKELTDQLDLVFKNAFLDAARSAGMIASIFVLLGAASSLFIPNPPKRKSEVVAVVE